MPPRGDLVSEKHPFSDVTHRTPRTPCPACVRLGRRARRQGPFVVGLGPSSGACHETRGTCVRCGHDRGRGGARRLLGPARANEQRRQQTRGPLTWGAPAAVATPTATLAVPP